MDQVTTPLPPPVGNNGQKSKMTETEKALFAQLAEAIEKTALPRVTTDAARDLRQVIASWLYRLQQQITSAIREAK
jgi:hypothetical protein